MQFSFNQKLLMLSAVLLTGIGLTGYAVYKSNQKLVESAHWVQHTQQVITESGNVLLLAKDIGTQGFAITNDSEFLAPFLASQAVIFKNIRQLRRLTQDNPQQQKRVDSLEWYVQRRIYFSQLVIGTRIEHGLEATLKLISTKEGKSYSDHIRKIVEELQQDESQLLMQRQQANEQSIAMLNRISLAMFMGMAGFVILLLVAIRNYLKQQQIHANAIKAWGDELKENVKTIADFKTLFESAPGLFLILKPDLIIDAVSDEYLAATMTKRDEIMGRHLFEVFPDNPDDAMADGVSNLRASLNTVLQTKAAHAMALQKYDIRRVDGTFEERYWSPLNKPVVNVRGEVVYIIHSAVDVTQRVKDESELLRSSNEIKELYDKAPCGYFSVDADILLCNINQTLLDWLGYTDEEVLGKMKYEDLLSPESRQKHLSSFEEVFAAYIKNGYVNDLEYEFKRKDGTVFPALVNSVAVVDDHGNFVKSRSTVFDNTERKKAEEQLKAVNKELESFSYSVSHDLRAPLRAINGFTGIIYEDHSATLDDDAKRMMRTIMFNAKKMSQLIDDLLNFSRLSRRELAKNTIAMNDMVEAICNELKDLHANRNIEFKIHALPNVIADGMIKQVWENLISNAVKYSGQRENAVVEIKTETKAGEVIFSVTDNGAGFDMRYANKLFGVFQRLHSEDEFEGTGVGLAIVQRVISKHGGRVWAHSRVNEGATFCFSLPRN